MTFTVVLPPAPRTPLALLALGLRRAAGLRRVAARRGAERAPPQHRAAPATPPAPLLAALPQILCGLPAAVPRPRRLTLIWSGRPR